MPMIKMAALDPATFWYQLVVVVIMIMMIIIGVANNECSLQTG